MKQHEQARVQQFVRPKSGDWAPVEDFQLEAITQTAASCIEGGKRFIYDLASDELRLIFEDETEQSFELLSDGYRNLVAMVADIAWRAVRLNPHLGIDAPTESTGVVLINEIELHLHPAWQRTVIKRLRNAFPKIQFVVTTHSPQVLAGVEASLPRCSGAGTSGLDLRGSRH